MRRLTRLEAGQVADQAEGSDISPLIQDGLPAVGLANAVQWTLPRCCGSQADRTRVSLRARKALTRSARVTMPTRRPGS